MPDVFFGKKEEVETEHRTANCPVCGRFTKSSEPNYAYDGEGTQCYVTFYCTKCGDFTEGLW